MAGMEDAVSYMMGANSQTHRGDGFGWGGGYGMLFFLFVFLFLFRGNGWGGNESMNTVGYDALLSGQNAIKSQMSYDNLNSGLRGISNGICDSSYAVNNTLMGGFASVNGNLSNGVASLQNALCQGFGGINTAITNSGWMTTEKINTVAAANNLQLQNIANTIQSCCCQTQQTIIANTQKILDRMCQEETQCLRDRNFEYSQKLQTAEIISKLPTTTTTTTA